MGRSSIIVWFACVFTAMPVLANARPAMMHGQLAGTGPRLATRAALPPARQGMMLRPQRIAMRAGRYVRGARRGGFGVDGVGLGLSLVSDLATPPVEAGTYGPLPVEPTVIPGLAPPPCPRPLIIKVGLGLRHVPPTRVTYGTPTTCIP